MRTFTFTVCAFLVLIFSAGSAQAQLAKSKKWKIGLNRLSSGVSYTYETRYKDEADETTYTSLSKKSSGTISNTEFMVEYIFAGLLGVELNFNLTPGIRNFSFDIENEKVGDIVEEVKSGALYGANLYFTDHTSPGFKIFVGLLTGTFQVTHTYSNGGDRPATLESAEADTKASNFKANQASSKTIPVQILKGGIDWIKDTVGFRFQLAAIQASETKTSSSLPKTSLSQKQTETVTLSGGLTLGIFGHF